jgi:hypothetical protein
VVLEASSDLLMTDIKCWKMTTRREVREQCNSRHDAWVKIISGESASFFLAAAWWTETILAAE